MGSRESHPINPVVNTEFIDFKTQCLDCYRSYNNKDQELHYKNPKHLYISSLKLGDFIFGFPWLRRMYVDTNRILKVFLGEYCWRYKLKPSKKGLYYIIYVLLHITTTHPEDIKKIQHELRTLVSNYGKEYTIKHYAHEVMKVDLFVSYMEKEYSTLDTYDPSVLNLIKQYIE